MTNLEHLLNSMEKVKNMDVTIINKGSTINTGYIVINNEKAYNISINEKNEIIGCDCPHHHFRGVICKHIIKVSMEKGLNIKQLNKED